MRSNRELLTEAYRAFNERDIDAVLALMSEDVDWPNAMEGARVIGHDGVRAYWTRQWKQLDPQVHPVRMTDESTGETLVDVHQIVRDLDGRLLMDQRVEHAYRIENGLITHMEIRSSSNTSPRLVE
jgi:ketosteroid isomerase-like protein